MAKAKKRKAKKRQAVSRAERVEATPETLAKLRPDPLERLLRKGPQDGGIDHQQFEALWAIKEAANVVGRGLGYQAVDFERVGHGRGDMSDGDSRLWDIYIAWSGMFCQSTYVLPRVVTDWVVGDRDIRDIDVPILLCAAPCGNGAHPPTIASAGPSGR